ncbi:conserved unknown protein [Ectocarpus siliculosus]|uniref:Intraflagellar Transport Protein 57 n=1 Tax=Ectocarpus siliculosus TaxID=2880 RepID=D8LLK4_ECTSI|nr:conserved unknown protein [Ectocarpus siliculosus]|eukprot:CBN74635.1 conserved unknown protein [Ectocarpus siliculosus]
MAEGGDAGRVRRTQGDDSPYSSTAFTAWEDALEKLKALDYEASFCKPNNLQPFNRSYFSIPGSNASLQVDKYDDPNTAVNKLMLALTGMGFDLNFPANRLKQAYGEAACSVLNFLTDKALSATGFVWRRPVYAAEDAAEEAEPVDDCDMADIADEAEVEEEQEDEQDFSDLIKAEEDDDMGVNDSQAAMLEAKVDPVEWKRELERVGPKLKMAASAAGKEWRGHVEQTKKHEEAIQAALPVTTTQLALIGTEVTESVEKMRVKERFINNQHDGLREEYVQLHDELKAVELKHQTTSGSVGELTESLSALSDELQELKEKMDSKGDAMSEASPLVSIKQALQQIKAEIKTFDLRIGVVSHTLLSTKIRRSKGTASEANSPKGSRGGGTNSSSRRTAGIGGDDEEDFDMSDSGDD